jgi:GTP pyrophosphokinase
MKSSAIPGSLLSGLAPAEKKRLRDAHAFGQRYLLSIKRRSAENYTTHGTEVALTLKELSNNPILLCTALLHDILLHDEGKKLLAQAPLVPIERTLISKMHKLRRLHIDAQTKDLETVVQAFTGDQRLLILRMAHRLTDVRHLSRFDRHVRKSIAHESLHMYAPIAGRLGLSTWKREMENICFRELHPSIARKLEKEFQKRQSLDTLCLKQTKEFLSRKFKEKNITCNISVRMKDIYSTYRKMIVKRRKFDELTDRLALRIIVQTVDDCYFALGIVHQWFHAIPGKMKDYISLPKENGYQSLHTVVYPLPGVTEQPIEIQIRTSAMHDQCQKGIASHGEYKHVTHLLSSNLARVDIARNLLHIKDHTLSATQFEEALRTYFSEDQIGIFDVHNNLYHMRSPATALDFVCHSFKEKCAHMRSIRINGREQSLDTVLKNGDTVQPLFSRKNTVKRVWLQWCHHIASRELLKKKIKALPLGRAFGSSKKRLV